MHPATRQTSGSAGGLFSPAFPIMGIVIRRFAVKMACCLTVARVRYSMGRKEHAQPITAHESARTTKLYDRRGDQVSLDEIERILI